jgi:EAL domain-containing protein (putative c-di-GMP-specific phosphodiesterase class I)
MIFGYEVLYKKEHSSAYPSASNILESVISSCGHRRNLQLFINMTVKDVVDDGFCRSFLHILKKTKVDGSNIVLEVSEKTHPDSLSSAKKTLSLLRHHNIKVALDDFGTEYSSLSFLKELPIDIVKIDKKFTQEAPSSKKSRALLKFCAQISHDIGCEVVAEGIETQDQLDCVKNSGADIGQGFLFTDPLRNLRQKITPFIGLDEFASFPIDVAHKVLYC